MCCSRGCVGSQIRLVALKCTLVLPNGQTSNQSDLTAYTATAATHLINTSTSSAPEDGHKVSRNMLSNL